MPISSEPWRATVADLETALRRIIGNGTVLCLGQDASRARLQRWFDEVVCEDTAAGALVRARDEAVLLALVDVSSGSEGLTFLQEALELQPRLSLVAIASPSDAASLRELLELGIPHVVFAPLDDERLLEQIHRAVTSAHDVRRTSRYLSRLEAEVRLRTDELREAQAQVVRLQEAKDNMLALISHEIRTPLNGILGFIDLLRSPEFSSDASAFLVHVEESARRLERSTRKALDFASWSTGLRPVVHQPHRVRTLLEAAQEQLGLRVGGGLTVDWQGAEILDTDGELLVQIFRNLLENTAKYGGPSVHVTVSLTREGRWDVLRFCDDGRGFSQDVLPTLFQPFSTGGIMHHSEGMGLGLALVDVIMLTLGGRVEAGNAPDGGAEVRLRFPVRER